MYLQAEGYLDDLYWFIGALIVLGIVFYLTRKAQHTQRAKNLKTNDPRHNVVNDSSYNIHEDTIKQEGDDRELTAEEAERVTQDMKDQGHIPSEEEFYDLKEARKKDK